ncbi:MULTISPECIES: LysR family transcriptional regulator [unclassified Brenneria]|uniref:LysR family transcriptional regulator n=1 Tax=unclassified Brenneria TaxID=2634434 RepID=UPI0018F0DFBC|nr:LysR family transcriptional regulator [Brenneria sp. L3-3C-1]MBJ7220323.1 LysR family transcriptional regulator [Brenneria sp. L3-3C-1]MEE3641568.1 LysR family transcriptional regulator [Brenneria sp. L3_3C_1]
MHLDLRQLRNFLALAEHGSFVQAAESVCLSQSAFSRSIQTLEQTMGYPLIDRQSKRFALTWQGKKLLPFARRIQELSWELINDMQQISDEGGGELTFGCGPAPAVALIPLAVAHFHQLRPRDRVAYSVDNWQSLRQRLLADEWPFFVADTWHAELEDRFRVQPLSQQRCFFICHRSHPLAQQARVMPDELLRYPLASPYLPVGMRKILATLTRQPDFRPQIQCDHIYSLFNVLCHTQAISFASEDGFALGHRSHQLVEIPLAETPPEWGEMRTRFGIISNLQKNLPPLAQLMIDTLIEQDRQRQSDDYFTDA